MTPSAASMQNIRQQARILVVDDHAPNVELALDVLAHEGYLHVRGTTEPRDLLALHAELDPDLIVLDVMLPDEDGFSLCRWVRQHPRQAQVPIIKLLLENHAYIDAESPNGTTPLMMASMYGNAEAVQLLIDEGADPMLKNSQGLTAQQFALKAERPDSAALILKAIRSKQSPGKW